jgi:hypothetical protein
MLSHNVLFQVRCWEVEQTGKTIPKSMQTMQGPVLDVCWSDVSDSLIKIQIIWDVNAISAVNSCQLTWCSFL